VTLPELEAPAKIVFDSEQRFDNDAYFAFCAANPDLRIERSSRGEIIIVPPAGSESSHLNLRICMQLGIWADEDGRGKAFDSSGEFILPSGAAYAPDASWVSNVPLSRFTKKQRRKFLAVVPEFVIEVMSPSDRLAKAQQRAQEWINEGVDLVWLIDGHTKTVYVYRSSEGPEKFTGLSKIAGEGPVEGFVLQLSKIWAGL